MFPYIDYLMILSVTLDYIAYNDWKAMNNVLKLIWKETVSLGVGGGVVSIIFT
jgi:hypothetical protein